MQIGNIPVSELVEQYGSPIFVYDEQKIRENYRRAKNAFEKRYPNTRIFYAIKANCNLSIAKILVDEGAGIDAASINEILLAQKLGLSGEDVIFSGNFLSDADIKQGIASNVIFNLDDISLLPRLLEFGTPELLSFRVNPGTGKSNVGEFVVTGGERAKFGIKPEDVMSAYRQAKEAGIKRFGVHMMAGSCVLEPEYFEEITSRLLDIVGKVSQELDINFEFIDLGGGLGIPYREEESTLDIEETAERVVNVFNQKIQEYNLQPPRLMLEPARYFVGDAGWLIGKVHSIKNSYQTIYGTDLSMNILPRVVLYDAYHRFTINEKENAPTSPKNLCGQICEQTDLWGKNINLPDIEVGDIVIMENCGAYCYGMSFQYNGRLLPAEILVNGNESHLIRTAQTLEDLTRNVIIPNHLT